jgi:hypothetical protein
MFRTYLRAKIGETQAHIGKQCGELTLTSSTDKPLPMVDTRSSMFSNVVGEHKVELQTKTIRGSE